jgi:hypothetical protein
MATTDDTLAGRVLARPESLRMVLGIVPMATVGERMCREVHGLVCGVVAGLVATGLNRSRALRVVRELLPVGTRPEHLPACYPDELL